MQYVELKHQEERTGVYLGSPALVRLSDGTLLASHDYFGNLKNLNGEAGLTTVYRSEDNGETWNEITHIIGAFWMQMFVCGEIVYAISCTQEYGDVVIRRSLDGGFTWSLPKEEETGLLLKSGPGRQNPNFQVTPRPTIWNGRVYLPLDDMHVVPGGPDWVPPYFHTLVLSAPVDADLLRKDNWTISNEIPFDFRKVTIPGLADKDSGWLEGNIIPAPDGRLFNIIRMHLCQRNKAGILILSPDGKQLSFDYSDIIDFPGGSTNFKISQDPVTGYYLAMANEIIGDFETIRNFLVLSVSKDLRHWKRACVLMQDDTGLEPEVSRHYTGFQYATWLFDGEDLIYLVRTAYRGAHNFHDSNRIVFRRLKKFRCFLEEI